MRTAANAAGSNIGKTGNESSRSAGLVSLLIALVAVLVFLFRDSFKADMALFANDGPLGLVASKMNVMPEGWKRVWLDINWLGFDGVGRPRTWTFLMFWLLGPLGSINFSPAIACLLVGFSVWLFCRAAGLRGEAAAIAGIAGALNTDFFSYACWGLPTLTACVASVFLALAALAWRSCPLLLRCFLGGTALGHALMEGFDNGAIFSLYVAAFAVFQPWAEQEAGTSARRLLNGAVRTGIVAVLSGLVSAHILMSLVQANITTVSGMGQDSESRESRWSFVTQWSLPPKEALRAIIPGLNGYRMDSPEGGQYWGKVGMHPAWDAFWKRPNPDFKDAPRESLRFSGAGHYLGVMVALMAAFAVAQSFRGPRSSLSPVERRWVMFWAVAALVSLLLAFGRFAPFYRIIFAIPYFNTIRNPVKFLHPFSLSVVILCGYGVQALWNGWVERARSKRPGVISSLKDLWNNGDLWERRWSTLLLCATGMSLLGWLIYGSQRRSLASYLQLVGFGPADAEAISRFSVGEVGLFACTLAVSAVFVLLAMSGWFQVKHKRLAFSILALVALLDLTRANVPWVIHYNWKDRLASNAVIDILKERPFEGRVAGNMPFSIPGEGGRLQQMLGSVYSVEWMQHQFPYFDVQALEVVQLPRPPADYMAYKQALQSNPVREWELSNVRYLLTLAPVVEAMNQQWDPVRRSFRVKTSFQLSQTPSGVIQAETNTAGPFALVEFGGALPRAMLFDRWRSGVEDTEVLSLLASTNFNPATEVLIAEPAPAPSVDTATQPAGLARYRSYSSVDFVIETESRTPCMLLVNDRFDRNWKVRVDGQEEPLLRANFLMRGVYLKPGAHQVRFSFEPPSRFLLLTAMVLFTAVGLAVYRACFFRPRPGGY